MTESFPNPLQVDFGRGRIYVSSFSGDGGHGLILKNRGIDHEIGLIVDTLDESYVPEVGDIFLKFSNRKSAQVVREMLDVVINKFDGNGSA